MLRYNMITIDNLLLDLNKNITTARTLKNSKDLRIISSLAAQVEQNQFLTENQSKLLLRILSDNLIEFKKIEENIEEIIKNNQWSRPFRVLQYIRKLYISPDDVTYLKIEFTYDKKIKDAIWGLEKVIQGKCYAIDPRTYVLPFTEQNVYHVVKELVNHNFEIDDNIMQFYCEIEKIISNPGCTFFVKDSKNTRMRHMLENEVGSIDKASLALLHDRKFRYQYEVFDKISEKSLKNSIAQRAKPKIFIQQQSISLVEIIGALKDLNRLPLLVVFDGHDAIASKKTLDLLTDALEKNGIFDNVGIYFRFAKGEDPNGFNQTIAEKQYNKNLGTTTQVAGIAINKLPKFMVEMQWKPAAVISFSTNFKNVKSSVYFNDADLIIFYTIRQPLSEDVDVIV